MLGFPSICLLALDIFGMFLGRFLMNLYKSFVRVLKT